MSPDELAELLEGERGRRRVTEIVELTVGADVLDPDDDGSLRGKR